jgi:C4-dicarboxylate-specific signal transduction histidine kinase
MNTDSPDAKRLLHELQVHLVDLKKQNDELRKTIAERNEMEEILRFMGQCGISESTEGFFHDLARYLARTLDMEFVCIDRLEQDHLSAETLAMFHNGHFEDNISYTLHDTPCGAVVGKRICSFPKNICGLFPNDAVLQDLHAESYLGTTLWSSQGKPIGLIAVIGRTPLEDTRFGESVLQLVSVRASGELERLQAEVKLKQMNDDLEKLVDMRTQELKNTLETLKVESVERINAMETLREKERMLIQQSRQAALGEMIGNIAHQWRQPLNSLGLYTQSLGLFYGTPDFNKKFLDSAIAKSMKIIKHMSKTIDDFRDYFKPERDKADFYAIEAIKSTLSLLEGNFQNPKITVDLVERDNPVINGYQNEFAQVFLNILNNARDAIIERETVDARVTITIYSENDSAVVTVADNAGGIPDEVIGKVFDPYFTTKGPQSGTGIGLFMSKTIIEKNMGGKLTVRNSDSGAEFMIEVGKG